MSYRILLVDDEPDILELLSYNLRKEGYQVDTARNGDEGVEKARAMRPHLILLDVMMPGRDGLQTCRAIRATPELRSTMIAFLTARSQDEAQIEGFEAGADDYIAKIVKIPVLVSRVKALLKRQSMLVGSFSEESSPREITIDYESRQVVKDGRKIVMPRKEFALLWLLHSRPGKVFSREEIFSAVWGDEVIVGDRTIDVHIRKLREKIGEGHIVTLKGVGYKYVD